VLVCCRSASRQNRASSPQFFLNVTMASVREMQAQDIGATEIAEALGIGRASVYRVLEEAGA
jgi:hypothetical protein